MQNLTTFWTNGSFLINISWEGNLTYLGNSTSFYVNVLTTTTTTTTATTSTTTSSTSSTSTSTTQTTTSSTSTSSTETTTTSTTTSTTLSTTTTTETSTSSTSTTISSTTTTTSSTTSTTTIQPLILIINSPNQLVYNIRRIPINLSTNEIVDNITYIDYLDRKPKEKVLCKNCNEYGLSRKRMDTFSDDLQNMTFKATKNSSSVENTTLFLVDTKEPVIRKTLPKRKGYSNGSFIIEYQEDNVKQIMLNYGNNFLGKSDCPLNSEERTQMCEFNVNLSEFNNNSLIYWFEIEDIAGNKDTSRETEINVDTIQPNITNLGFNINRRTVKFNITISEKADLEYYDENERRPNWKSFCNNCEVYDRSKTFNAGNHNLIIRATDKANNIDDEELFFLV